jgi:hypothetical protein
LAISPDLVMKERFRRGNGGGNRAGEKRDRKEKKQSPQ